MRRKQNEITDKKDLFQVIQDCDVLRIGLSVDNVPYIVPMNFGFDGKAFYCHCATEGRKLDMIAVNPKVCFEMDTHHKLVDAGHAACNWTMTYASVMGTGTIHILESLADKTYGLNQIMAQYGGKDAYEYPEKAMAKTLVFRLDIDDMTGKKK